MYKITENNKPAINTIVKVDGDLGDDVTLSHVIRRKVVSLSSSLQYNDDTNKSAKCKSDDEDINIKDLLNEPIGICQTYITDPSNKKVVVIVLDCGVSVVKPTNNMFQQMMESRKPISIVPKPKFGYLQVNQFLNGFTSAPSRAYYLNSIDKTKKTSMNDQIESFLVKVLDDNNLGYYQRQDKTEEKQMKKAILNTIPVFGIIQDFRHILFPRQKRSFETTILQYVDHCQSVKLNKRKLPPLTKGKLKEYISGVDVAFNLWPSWYHRINSTSKVRRGEIILSKLENAKMIF